jgi:RimJ/RimL family protein N-acetyltransferase/putative methionine-R-sulfoxide reductase with GAF domain
MTDLFDEFGLLGAGSEPREVRGKQFAEKIRGLGDYRWVGVYDVGSEVVSNFAWSGPGAPAYPTFPITTGLTGAAIRERQAVVVGDVRTDPRYLTAFGSTLSEIIIPVFNPENGKIVGTVDVESERPNAFTDRDRRSLEQWARQGLGLWINPVVPVALRTPRLILRQWRDSDAEAFWGINSDPAVLEFLQALSRAESDDRAMRIRRGIGWRGFGLFAVEVPGVADFVGFVGLSAPSWEAHFTPCLEIGWRIASKHWGKGYAPEAARAVAEFAFERLGLREIVSLTAPANLRSRRVMEKIGMTRSAEDDFDHPLDAKDNPFCRHVLYRLKRPN